MLTATIPDILARIVARKAEELERADVSRADLERLARGICRRGFRRALESSRPAIIAEIKQASPSRGKLASFFDPALLATQYQAGGAAAISVLTDRDFFQGSLADLEAARAAVALPVLRKDFTTSEYHILEAAASGADAILLIAAILDHEQLRGFRELAAAFGMDALVEVHDEAELDLALSSGAAIIGVNNRNLRTFEVDLGVSTRLEERIPNGIVKVAESGILTAGDVHRLPGYHAFLVGESLMKSGDPVQAIRNLCL